MLWARRNIDKEIEDFVNRLSDLWKDDDPLDCDETQEIADRVLAELNFRNGNMDGEEVKVFLENKK